MSSRGLISDMNGSHVQDESLNRIQALRLLLAEWQLTVQALEDAQQDPSLAVNKSKTRWRVQTLGVVVYRQFLAIGTQMKRTLSMRSITPASQQFARLEASFVQLLSRVKRTCGLDVQSLADDSARVDSAISNGTGSDRTRAQTVSNTWLTGASQASHQTEDPLWQPVIGPVLRGFSGTGCDRVFGVLPREEPSASPNQIWSSSPVASPLRGLEGCAGAFCLIAVPESALGSLPVISALRLAVQVQQDCVAAASYLLQTLGSGVSGQLSYELIVFSSPTATHPLRLLDRASVSCPISTDPSSTSDRSVVLALDVSALLQSAQRLPVADTSNGSSLNGAAPVNGVAAPHGARTRGSSITTYVATTVQLAIMIVRRLTWRSAASTQSLFGSNTLLASNSSGVIAQSPAPASAAAMQPSASFDTTAFMSFLPHVSVRVTSIALLRPAPRRLLRSSVPSRIESRAEPQPVPTQNAVASSVQTGSASIIIRPSGADAHTIVITPAANTNAMVSTSAPAASAEVTAAISGSGVAIAPQGQQVTRRPRSSWRRFDSELDESLLGARAPLLALGVGINKGSEDATAIKLLESMLTDPLTFIDRVAFKAAELRRRSSTGITLGSGTHSAGPTRSPSASPLPSARAASPELPRSPSAQSTLSEKDMAQIGLPLSARSADGLPAALGPASSQIAIVVSPDAEAKTGTLAVASTAAGTSGSAEVKTPSTPTHGYGTAVITRFEAPREVVSSILQIYVSHRRLLALMLPLMRRDIDRNEVESGGSLATLFRTSSIFTTISSAFLEIYARDYLIDVLAAPIRKICTGEIRSLIKLPPAEVDGDDDVDDGPAVEQPVSPAQAESIPFSFELNPYKADFRVSNAALVHASVELIADALLSSVERIPHPVRLYLAAAARELTIRYSDLSPRRGSARRHSGSHPSVVQTASAATATEHEAPSVSPAAAEAKAGSSLLAEPEDASLDGGRGRSRSHGDLAGIISDDRVAIDLDNPVDTAISGRCINVLFILRFVCPAILNVHTAGLLPADVPVPHTVQRGLLYISQIINNVANMVRFTNKDKFMQVMNRHVDLNRGRVLLFHQQLSRYGIDERVAAEARVTLQERHPGWSGNHAAAVTANLKQIEQFLNSEVPLSSRKPVTAALTKQASMKGLVQKPKKSFLSRMFCGCGGDEAVPVQESNMQPAKK